jgi:hypothetical protein
MALPIGAVAGLYGCVPSLPVDGSSLIVIRYPELDVVASTSTLIGESDVLLSYAGMAPSPVPPAVACEKVGVPTASIERSCRRAVGSMQFRTHLRRWPGGQRCGLLLESCRLCD